MLATTTRNDLTTLFGVGAVGQLSDAELLTRFTDGQRDAVSEAAFEVIVARHGPMVLGVCRRVLGDAHAAADAYQATFLILSRNATSVHIEDSLGRWLYGVSIRVARRARAIALAERARVLALNEFDPPDEAAPSDPCQHDDLRTAIDEEIARLPSRYRSVVVLCYLEGLTQEQAARRLRCPLGTIQSRLHRARERLRSGLSRRGLAPTSWCSATLAAMTARAEVPPKLTATVISIGGRLTKGGALREAVPGAVAALAKQTLREMLITKIWWTGLMLMALGLSATGAVALAIDRRDGGERAKAPVLLSDTTQASARAATTSQTSLNGNQIRVAVDRNSNWVDSVWWFGTVDSPTVGYQRNGVYKASFTVPGAIYPDCDMDDWGNSYIVYQAPDPSINNNPSIYLVVNFLPAVKVSGTAGGVNPTVTVCRGKGRLPRTTDASPSPGTAGQSAAADIIQQSWRRLTVLLAGSTWDRRG